MSTALAILAVYMLATIVISIVSAVRSRGANAGSFMAAKGELAWVFLIPLLFAEMIAGSGTIGNAAAGFTTGLSAVWMNWGMVIGVLLFTVLVLKFYKSVNATKNVISVPAAYKCIFDERCRIVMLFVIVIVYLILFSTQPVAAAAIIGPMVGVDETVVAWVIAAVFIGVTLLGGMKGVAFMNVVHAFVMVVGMALVAFVALERAGGFEALHASLPATYFSFAQPDMPTTVASALGTGISMIASATTVSVCFAAKDLRNARIGMVAAALIIAPFALLPAIIGMCAQVVLPDIAANGALFSMANHVGGVYGGIASMAIIAAIWSTAPALMLICATTLTKDFYKHAKPQATDHQELLFSKFCVVAVGIAGTFLGLNASSILDQMYGAFQIRSIVAIVLIAAIFWKRVSTTAAFWSMLSGGILAAGWFFAGNPFGVSCFWPGAALCLIVLVPLTLTSRDKVSPGYRAYRQALDEMTALERKEQPQ